jgi:ubiquinone biosynthesis protein
MSINAPSFVDEGPRISPLGRSAAMNDRSPLETTAVPEGELARLAHIARIAAAKGLGHYAERLGFGSHGATPADGSKSDALRFREALEELGPTFVKLGQMMAGRSDLFPEELIAELGSLHEHAAEFPAEAARRIIEQETGKPVAELYATFEDVPMAAASIAQVHCATLFDGTEVIVKVQRPGIAATVEADIAVLRRVARLLGAAIPSVRSFNLPDLVEELAETLRGELDFEHEAHNAERFAETNADEPAVLVPRIFWHATTRRVLTMEHSPGHRVDTAPMDSARNAQTAQLLMRLFLVQVFEHGVFHGDPHPGNIFVLEDARLCFHDFGALGELSPRVQEKLRELFLGVVARDAGWVASAYLGMGGATVELDRAQFTRDLGTALERYYRESSLGRQSFSAIMHEFVRLGRQHHIRLLRETALLLRAFAELEALVRGLDPQFSSIDAFRAYSGRLLRQALTPDLGMARIAQLYRGASALKESAADAPIALRRLLGRLERGDPLFDIRYQSGGSIERHLLHASNRLAFALIVASVVVGSAIVMAAHAGPHLGEFSLLGVVGFIVAGVLGLAWAVIALKSGHL